MADNNTIQDTQDNENETKNEKRGFDPGNPFASNSANKDKNGQKKIIETKI